MRIVIDLQAAQAGNRNRGIGRYAIALALALVRNKGEHEILICLNGLFTESIEIIRTAFDGLLPNENIRIWAPVSPVANIDTNNLWRRQSAEFLREAFLASLKPDVLLVSSLFEGLTDDAVTSVGKLSNNYITAVMLYDLIPYLHPHLYLENPAVKSWYLEKIQHLKRADLFLSISKSSRQEGIAHLGFSEIQSVNISSDVDAHFQPQKVSEESELSLRQKYALHRPFVMYTGGIDHRKNIEGLIRAFSKLPCTLRMRYQLVIVCSVDPESRSLIEQLVTNQGLGNDDVVLTGYVSENDLLELYNLCSLFVFPSWHEGFGLPALEAMKCGAPVISANTSSLPEIIGWEEAMFDPHSDDAIAVTIERALCDSTFREDLIYNSLKQSAKFSWDDSAQVALGVMDQMHLESTANEVLKVNFSPRPRLAYVSPLPPEKSGIAGYSADLLPELARHYEIDVIIDQNDISDTWILENCSVRSVSWFVDNSDKYERVLYHFGNSYFHQHMFDLLKKIPGVVVLHDFFLAHVYAHIEGTGYQLDAWSKALYFSHGYKALKERFQDLDAAKVIWNYPCNLDVIQSALGVIVHSEHPRKLADHWFGPTTSEGWVKVPLLRLSKGQFNKAEARSRLNLDNNDFVVCSFGLLGPAKLNHRLLNAWLQSTISRSTNSKLIFVGENIHDKYGEDLLDRVSLSGIENRIHITGWTDSDMFNLYLAAADVAVQLRNNSRGETSAAVLDCMNYGLATIVNAHGSMADLSDDSVFKISDQFSDLELTAALESLFDNPTKLHQMGLRAQHIIQTLHSPPTCADQYAHSIEVMYRTAASGVHSLINALTLANTSKNNQGALIDLSESIAQSISPKPAIPQLFVDISELVIVDYKTGIQRVVLSILKELLTNPPKGYRVEPVYANFSGKGYRYARKYTMQMLNCPISSLSDDFIEYSNCDIFLGLDLSHNITLANEKFYQKMRLFGVKVHFVVYDLLPLKFPHFWNPIHKIDEFHHNWLKLVSNTDGAICISNTVADELFEWVSTYGPKRLRPFKIGWFHLGADIETSRPSTLISIDELNFIKSFKLSHNFLMVGTIEPRKGYEQCLAAFERLWDQGVEVNLVIVGKQGWMVESLVIKIRKHPKLGKQLFWLEAISDAYLEKVYDACNCLIAASYGEGFGLPLIEAAQNELPIIARDIPVFREVAGEFAFYFSGTEADDLVNAINIWLALYDKNLHPSSTNMPWLNWRESTKNLMESIIGNPYP